MQAQVLLITGREQPLSLLPPHHALPDVLVSSPQAALRTIGEHRARGVPVVAVVDTARADVQAVLVDCAVKYPEVPLILASPEDPVDSAVPSRAVRRLAGSTGLLDAVQQASRTAVQQARVRTTLDRLNVRLRTPPTVAWDEGQQRRLFLSGLYLSSILEQARDGIFVLDRRGVVALWNGAAERLFGIAGAQVTGRRIDSIGPERQGPELLAAVRGLSAASPAAQIQVTFSGPDSYVLEVSLSLIRDEDTVGIAVSGIVRDVTEREALLRSVQQQAQELAISNRHKEEFLAVLSHELRTPLNTVLGWSRMLQTMPLDPARVRQAADSITRNAEVQRRLVSDLLDFAGISAGKLALRVTSTDLAALVAESVDALRPQLQRGGLSIVEAYDENVVVLLDPERVRQVVGNLLHNAMKFTPGGGQVTVTVRAAAHGGLLTVADTGSGIEPAFLEQMFDPFRQAEASTAGTQGLGLGLAISRGIVDLHGGTIRADSGGKGAGATFSVFLPAQVPARSAAEPEPPLASTQPA